MNTATNYIKLVLYNPTDEPMEFPDAIYGAEIITHDIPQTTPAQASPDWIILNCILLVTFFIGLILGLQFSKGGGKP